MLSVTSLFDPDSNYATDLTETTKRMAWAVEGAIVQTVKRWPGSWATFLLFSGQFCRRWWEVYWEMDALVCEKKKIWNLQCFHSKFDSSCVRQLICWVQHLGSVNIWLNWGRLGQSGNSSHIGKNKLATSLPIKLCCGLVHCCTLSLWYLGQHRNPNINNKDHLVGQLTSLGLHVRTHQSNPENKIIWVLVSQTMCSSSCMVRFSIFTSKPPI